MMRPLAIDLFCGLGGWTEGLLAEGYEVIGFDIEAHEYGDERYPGKLVLQDVLTLHGSQFKDAALIVASPPCQKYSWMAMPFSRGRAEAARIRADETGVALAELTALFDACFRIQREACKAAGRHIPLVVENVKGAQPWVGRSRWNFGSYHLWGDVPALMPPTIQGLKNVGPKWDAATGSGAHGMTRWTNPSEGVKRPGLKLSEEGFNVSMARELAPSLKGVKYKRTEDDKRQHLSIARKAASAKIAKIPFVLSSWIARTYKPVAERCA